MDIASLLHSITTQGLSLKLGEAPDTIAVLGPVATLTLEQQRALKEHKPTLLAMLNPPPPTTCYFPGDAGESDMQFADSPEAEQPLLRCMEYFQRLADAVQFHNPERLSQIVLEPEPQVEPCRRCGNFRTYLAIIHAGESLRRDCSQCGRFVSFPSWNNRELTAKILAAIVSDSRYNEAGHSNAANAQVALTQNLSSTKEPR